MSSPMTGNREFRDDIIRIASLTVREPRLEGYTFVNCQIFGPAVFAIGENVNMNHCTFEADVNSLFWEVDPLVRPVVFGAVGLNNVTFSACSFQAIGFAGTVELKRAFEQALSD